MTLDRLPVTRQILSGERDWLSTNQNLVTRLLFQQRIPAQRTSNRMKNDFVTACEVLGIRPVCQKLISVLALISFQLRCLNTGAGDELWPLVFESFKLKELKFKL